MYASAHPHRDNPFAWAMGPRGGRGGRGHHRGRGGPFGPWGPGFGGRGGPRARRGDVRAALLVLLAEEPRNGYGLMQEIESRSEGVWRPSPGSVYPALQQLEDEGLVEQTDDGGRKAYRLTDEGRAYVTAHPDEIAAPWAAMAETETDGDLRPLLGQVAAAMWQVMAVGSPEQQAAAKDAIVELRKTLYGILAEGAAAEASDGDRR
jgi:DNA-binding PadR family transcriptional regulator